VTVFVTNDDSGTVTPIRAAANAADLAITIGGHPLAIAITPDGKTAYALSAAPARQARSAPARTPPSRRSASGSGASPATW
jgi:DNA-binding beta-propeller fold protein YncE